jgi:hypothetical protein
LRSLSARSGVTVREMRNDANSEIEIVNVSGMKRSFVWPTRKIVGRNTMMVVIVAEKIGMATSRAASSTALRRGVPGMFRWRLMFSSSTIESSTRRPTASASPPSVKTLRVCPVKYMQMNESRIESGIAIEMMMVDVSERRKIKMMMNANAEPWIASCQRLWIAWRM